MGDYSLQIQKLLIKVEALEHPDDKIKLIKEALQLADIHNDVEWGFDLRKELIGHEKGTSRCIEGMPALSWLLEAHEQHSDIFEETEFMLEYKWMLMAACRNVNISGQQLEQIFENYKTRLQRNGYSLHPYYRTLAQLAFMTGNFDNAKRYIELREKEEHDDLSFCVACEVNDKAELEFRTGNIDGGLMTATDLFSHKVNCKYVPFETICNSINILATSGYSEKAAELFADADKELQETANDVSRISYISELIKYLTKTDGQKAWQYFEKYAVLSLNCEDYYAFKFALNILPLLQTEDKRTMRLSSLIPWYREDDTYNIQELYKYYRKQASDLAQRFDTRHITDYFTQQLSN